MRLFLALLILLSAPLSVAQHAGCGEAGAATTALAAGGEATGEAQHADQHQHSDTGAHAGDSHSSSCESCDLACLSACAAAAVPMSFAEPGKPAPVAGVFPAPAPGLLNPHLPPLLRPPSISPA
ncbi:hypothetical protein [Kineobactrum salinum]|uniref:CopL family metal-binding regulatory protein n=1 Tax=Kineobactrum salinum TaxID=2708301 RepID=A0A6C0U143_9GAMM|nr:hypothetical protein [Kineobactrum salinum]QIB65618.1 hypothetical protein G3T16_09575 [Kineobactrum salinum]